MENLIPTDLGLSEFVAKLVEETLEAVIACQASQTKRHSEIKDAVLLPLQSFANSYILQEDIDMELQVLFPHFTIVVDQLFNKTQWIDTLALLGVELYQDEDVKKDNLQQDRLTISGVFKIQNSVKLYLAFEKKKILQSLVASGIPRLQVDAGEITAKVNFNTTKSEQASSVNLNKANQRSINQPGLKKFEFSAKPLTGNSILKNQIQAETVPAVRVFVTQVNNSTASLANGYGEVKISFKTIW